MDTMKKITAGYYLKPKKERIFRIFSIAIFCFLILLFILHKVIGFDGIVESMYHGHSFGFLNNLIKYQQTKTVEHYITLADTVFYRSIFMSLLVLSFTNLLVRSILFGKSLRPIWVFLFGTAVIMGVHILNPNNRIYSSHGFMHVGIVYEILNGHFPPNNPLLAELPLYWPWGHHFLAAVFVKVFSISPPWAFCVINIAALLGVVSVIYKISRMFIDSPRANILSVLIALFAVSLMHAKAIPIFARFTNISGMPIGMYFYLLFVYTILLIFSDQKRWGIILIPLIISVVSVGFFYFQMLPGLLGSFGFFWLFRVIQMLKDKKYDDAKKIIFSTIAVLLGTLLILPYGLSISVNAKSTIDIMVPGFVWSNFKNFVLVSLPILIIIAVNLKNIKEKLNQQALYNFMLLNLGVLITYLALHFPAENEYKFLSQSVTLFGIIGGIVLSFYSQPRSKFVVILLILLLGYNFIIGSNYKLGKVFKEPHLFESGSKMVTKGEESEIYQWLMSNTAPYTTIIDTEMKVPYLAQRPLYAAKDKIVNGQVDIQAGYSFPVQLLFVTGSGYDKQIIDYRYGIIDKIYGMETSITDKELDEFFLTHPDILIIFRNQKPKRDFLQDKLTLVFESSNKSFNIYRPN